MTKVEIYTTTYCPHCQMAKMLLNNKGVDFEEINAEDDKIRMSMVKRSGGRKTVPQIFINDYHVGGNDDLQELDRSGKLDEMLK